MKIVNLTSSPYMHLLKTEVISRGSTLIHKMLQEYPYFIYIRILPYVDAYDDTARIGA